MHRKCSFMNSCNRQFRRRRGWNVEFFQLAAAEQHQPRLELLAPWRGHSHPDAPEFLGAEGFNLHLALDNQAQADRLDPARRLGPRQLAPQDRRQGKAHQIVQSPARKVSLDQRLIDLTRMQHGFGDGGLGDRVKGHPADLLALLDHAGQSLGQMPGNRLALAVRVGGEDQLIIGFQRLGDRLEVLAAVGGDLPHHGEIVVRVDRAILGRQVADMAIRGQNGIVAAQIFVDCLGFGRGFYNDNRHGIPFTKASRTNTWVGTLHGAARCEAMAGNVNRGIGRDFGGDLSGKLWALVRCGG